MFHTPPISAPASTYAPMALQSASTNFSVATVAAVTGSSVLPKDSLYPRYAKISPIKNYDPSDGVIFYATNYVSSSDMYSTPFEKPILPYASVPQLITAYASGHPVVTDSVSAVPSIA